MSSRSEQSPLISIVTIVKNDAKGLEKTIQSVQNQTYSNIEHIVIDGYSNDSTKNVIKRNIQNISRWISEPDFGIYDAMNKGIKIAKGEWILFLNSGHTLYNNDIFNDIFEGNDFIDEDVLYGDMVYNMKFGDVVKRCESIVYIWRGMSFSHNSTLIKSSMLKKCNYNLDYRFASDFDLMFKLYCNDYKFKYLPIIVSKREVEGKTNSNMVKSTIERYHIVLHYKNNIYIHGYYILLIIKYILRIMIPKQLLNTYYFVRYRSKKVI